MDDAGGGGDSAFAPAGGQLEARAEASSKHDLVEQMYDEKEGEQAEDPAAEAEKARLPEMGFLRR